MIRIDNRYVSEHCSETPRYNYSFAGKYSFCALLRASDQFLLVCMKSQKWTPISRNRDLFRPRVGLIILLAILVSTFVPWTTAVSYFFSDRLASVHSSLQYLNRKSGDYPLVADYIFTRVDMGYTQTCLRYDESLDARDVQWAVDKLSAPDLARFGTSASPIDLEVLRYLATFHQTARICGPVVEIGVYKGWFVSALSSLLARDSEKVFAFDLYAKQKENVDNSGGGQTHVPQIKYFWMIVDQIHAMKKVITVEANSLDLSADAMLSLVGYKPRLISIDGGHFRIATFHDLNTASRVLHPQGVIVVDDYNNLGWRGVKIAIATFIAIWPNDLQPFLATNAKLYLCKKNQHQNYLSTAQEWFPNSKTCEGHSMNFTTDDRVKLNTSLVSDFVDQTDSKTRIQFC